MKNLYRSAIIATPLMAIGMGHAHADAVTRAQTYIAQGKPRDAMLVLRNYLRNHTKDGPANFMLAKLDLALGSPVSAEREARAARAAQYQPDRALSILLESYLAQQRFIDLLHDFPLGSATGETGARLELGRAAAEQALHQPARATADLAQAKTFDDKLPAVWLALHTESLSHGDKQAAASDLAQAKSLAPNDHQVMLAEARAALAAGNPKDAITSLNALLAKDPSDITARLTLANAMIAGGQADQAQAQIDTVLKLAPGSVGALYLQAGLDVSHQKWKDAQSVLQRLSPLMAQLPGAYFLQAETLLHLGELGAAQQDAAHYVAHVPSDPAGRRLLAALALRNHHPHVALSAINGAGAAAKQDFGMTMLHAAAEQALGNIAQAKTDLQLAATLDPKNAAPLAHLGQIQLASGDVHGATTTFQKAAALSPSDPLLQAALAQAAIASGNQPVAHAAIAQLDHLKGPAAGSMLSAELHLAAFDLPGAEADYQTVLKAQPGNVPAMLGLAHIALLQGHEADAIAMTTKAVKAEPSNQAAVSALASMLASTKDFDKTNEVLQNAHKAAPNNPVFVADIASLDIRLKKLDAAKSLLDGVDPKMQNNPLIMAAKAQVALAGKDTAGAKTDLAALIQSNPQNVGARLALARLDVDAKDNAGADTVLTDGLKATPGNAVLMQAKIGVAFKQGGFKAALAAAEILAADPAQQPESLVLPGKTYLANHQPKHAIAAFQQAEQAHPSALLALNLAETQAITGDGAAAKQTLDQAIATYGALPPLENAAGQVALAGGDLKGAATYYQTALNRAPNDVLALNNLAWIAGKQHDATAPGLAARAYAISPTPQIADTLGWILAKQSHNLSQALVLLGQAHQGMPADPSVAYHYASVLAQTGDKTKAEAVLKPVLADKAPFPDRAAAEKLDASLGKS